MKSILLPATPLFVQQKRPRSSVTKETQTPKTQPGKNSLCHGRPPTKKGRTGPDFNAQEKNVRLSCQGPAKAATEGPPVQERAPWTRFFIGAKAEKLHFLPIEILKKKRGSSAITLFLEKPTIARLRYQGTPKSTVGVHIQKKTPSRGNLIPKKDPLAKKKKATPQRLGRGGL